MLAKGCRQAHVIGTWRNRPLLVAVTWPFQSDRRRAALAEIDIAPLERHHLAAPQPAFATQEHDRYAVRSVACAAVTNRSYSSKS